MGEKRLKVKICGIKNVEAARCAIESGADALGFVFAPSKRRMTPEQVKRITEEVPDHVWKVGVFTNEDVDIINHVASFAGLTHIQLHGDEQLDLYKEIDLPIIKSVSISHKKDAEQLESSSAQFLLLDSPPEFFRGGNGKSFDWFQVQGLGRRKTNLILAGGLTPDNVKSAIDIVRPYMVDVSSGVETDGEKDVSKIKAFIVNAKMTEEEMENGSYHL